jgi:hypothetical protein
MLMRTALFVRLMPLQATVGPQSIKTAEMTFLHEYEHKCSMPQLGK